MSTTTNTTHISAGNTPNSASSPIVVQPPITGSTGSPTETPDPMADANTDDVAPGDVAIRVAGVSKCYHVYAKPIDRLMQAVHRWKKQCYKEFWALHEIDLTLRRGETLGIIGRNGSGKSTLLQIICGILTPTTGSVEVRGEVSALLELGSGFNREFTGRENIYLAGAIRGLSRQRIDDVLDSILEFADIGHFVDQPMKTYSSGMFVRLAFSLSAHVKPDILIVDEALSVGDIFFQQKCARYMREQLSDTTKILVTHDMGSVAQHCDRVVVLSKGRLMFEGSPRDAIAYYTKIVHTEQFAKNAPSKNHPTQTDGASTNTAFIGANTRHANMPWVEVPDDKRGGAGTVTIGHVAITYPDGSAVGVLQPGDRFLCHSQVTTPEPIDSLIFGTLLNDRFGKPLCGDNTCSLDNPTTSLPAAGTYVVTLEYCWPEIQPDTYTMTFGVGQGDHPHQHDILCWAHNAIEVRSASPRKSINGLFNNPLISMGVRAHD